MSLDFDRSPDGEPRPAAGQAPVPAEQAPATADQESTLSPGFTPRHAAGEPEPDAYEPGPADGELAGHELADDELPDDVLPAAEPVLADPADADEPVAAGAVPAATASGATAHHSSVAPAGDAAAGLDGPLLSDTDELQASWQRIQVAFIDDPRAAVADAAGLVEHMGQVLVSALRQRQQQLRTMWDRDGMPDGVDYADSGAAAGTVSSGADRPAGDGGPDTEQLRLVIRRYRALFNELCRP